VDVIPGVAVLIGACGVGGVHDDTIIVRIRRMAGLDLINFFITPRSALSKI
jgi:hypothetical protein